MTHIIKRLNSKRISICTAVPLLSCGVLAIYTQNLLSTRSNQMQIHNFTFLVNYKFHQKSREKITSKSNSIHEAILLSNVIHLKDFANRFLFLFFSFRCCRLCFAGFSRSVRSLGERDFNWRTLNIIESSQVSSTERRLYTLHVCIRIQF